MLISLQDLETYLQIEIAGTDNEAKYEFLIGSVQDLADSITYRTLEETGHIAEKHDGDGTDELYINNYPIVSIEEVKYGSAWGNTATSEITDYLVDTDIGRLSFGFNSIDSVNQIWEVTYTAGWTGDDPSGSGNVPDDLKLALLEQIQTTFVTKYVDSGIKSTKMGDAKLEYFSSSDKGGTSSFAQKLSKYIRSDI